MAARGLRPQWLVISDQWLVLRINRSVILSRHDRKHKTVGSDQWLVISFAYQS
jgi:hypothetical protein